MTAPPPSDSELVARWRGGDEAAASALVYRHARPLGRYLVTRGAASADVDDLLQETFFRAFRSIDGWRGETPIRGWLCRIAGNLLKDRFRQGGGRQFVELADDDRVDLADPAGEVMADDLATRLEDGLAALSPLQREVFLLRVEQGLGYREIAEQVGSTEGATRVHYHHAVKRLKERME